MLKEYINAYHLPAKAAIEKDDLIKIIFNTRPISNENECYYRRNRTRSTVKNSDDNSFSFSNLVQDLFNPSSSSSSEQQQQQEQQQKQQRQRQEQYRRRQQQQQQRQREEQLQAERQRVERERLERQQRELYERQQRESLLRQQQAFQSNNSSYRSTPSPSQSPPLSTDNLLSLHDMVKSNIDPASLSVRTLKSILKANYVEQSHVIEKSELVKLVQRLADQHKAEMQSRNAGDDSESGGNDDSLCRVCFDAQQNCVFLDCGHMVTCMDCAKKVITFRDLSL